jgi:hypothetical protein
MKKPQKLTDEQIAEMAKEANRPVEEFRKSVKVYEAAREAERLARRERRQKKTRQD